MPQAVPLRMTGLVTAEDVPPHDAPAQVWTAAENMSFRDIYAERVKGFRPIYDANAAIATPLHIQNNVYRGVSYWIYGCASAMGVTDTAGTHTDLTPAANAPSGVTSDEWSSCELNGFPVFNYRNAAGPHSWDRNTANNFIPLTGWPAGLICDVIRAHRFHLFGLNLSGTSDQPSVIIWSDAAAPGNLPAGSFPWTADPSSDSGSLSIGATGEGITDGLSLGNDLIVYKNSSAYQVFPDDTLVYGQRMLFRTVGCLASNCVTEWRRNHIVLADGDVVIHDGSEVRSLVDRAARRNIFANISQSNFARSFAYTDRTRDQVVICFPTSGSEYPDRALIWDATSDKVQFKDTLDIFGGLSFRDTKVGGSGTPHIQPGNISESVTATTWATVATNWDTDTTDWDSQDVVEAIDGLVGIDFDAGELVLFNSGDSYSTGSIQAKVQKLSVDFGEPNREKLVTELRPRIVGTAGQVVECRVGKQDNIDEPIQWSAFREFKIGENFYVPVDAMGRYLSFEFQTTDGSAWRISGFDAMIELAGMY